MAPTTGGRFSGSDAQRAHVDAMRRANMAEAAAPAKVTQDVAVKSHLGLDALKERKRKEEEDRRQKREAARAKRQGEESKREIEDEQGLAECEEQARRDADADERVKYEAALVVRIAMRFGSSGAWLRVAEARARGAAIPLDPRRVYLLAHPDKCPLVEASDATAILNAQRPPEMTEVRARTSAAVASNTAVATRPPAAEASDSPAPDEVAISAARPPKEERRVDPEDGAACTLEALTSKYSGTYTDEEIKDYWDYSCTRMPDDGSCASSNVAAPDVSEEPATVIRPKTSGSRRF